MEKLENLIESIKNNRAIHTRDEAAAKSGIIIPILHYLGWNVFDIDEVFPEYSVDNRKVDYSLRLNNVNKVFIEAKRASENLENHQGQLLEYSFKEGVKLAILTNGLAWWFYLPLNEGSWEQRKFYTIDIEGQEINSIVENFNNLLESKNVLSGEALKNAERIHKNKLKKNLFKSQIPNAWNKIISEGNEELIEILAESTEKLCGYRPDDQSVGDFLNNLKTSSNTPQIPNIEYKSKIAKPNIIRGNKVKSFTFNGQEYDVNSWKNVLMELLAILYKNHSEIFDRVFSLHGRKRVYFSRDSDEIFEPRQIEGTDIFVETNRSAENIVSFCKKIVKLFNYSEDDFKVIIK
ncbi:MAG: type I restriction endonuclease [Methanobacteriaceae archaeon]